ncbi:MAG: diaminopimelate epimerase [Bacteroidetes bacterium]|nr:diaminopimelate epimerase [Bacteroidota bacterium]
MIPFVKYQGSGNDFVIIDARNQEVKDLDVAAICHRRFGVGADGLMLLAPHPELDFTMVYYNSDGNLSSMCGNGGRCIAHFAHQLGLGNHGMLRFMAVDGPHEAIVKGNEVSLQMIDVGAPEFRDAQTAVLNTGSPHYVQFVSADPEELDVVKLAREIRYNAEFSKNGINVNFVHIHEPQWLRMRTYERGVEDETYSCGTGVTAAALAYASSHPSVNGPVRVDTPGGRLSVQFARLNNGFTQVVLNGPAVRVFEGILPE